MGEGRQRRALLRGAALGVTVVAIAACDTTPTLPGLEAVCDLDTSLLIASLAPDAIPAVTEPTMVTPDDSRADYLLDDDRVLGVVMNGEARAYPHNIFWHHEIVNDRIGDDWVSVTFCPLTGSGLAFDPELPGFGRLDLGVSGLLFANNLVMYDRTSRAVYGPQLNVEGSCNVFRDQSLDMIPVQEMSWGRWRALHPETTVVSGSLGYGRNYRFYPYGTYDDLNNEDLVMRMSVDRTRPIKERVLTVRVGDDGRGYPFLELRKLGPVAAVNEIIGGVPTAVLYEATEGMTALAFDARVGAQTLTFEADTVGGAWTDLETGSTWTLNGEAVAGPLRGERLQTRADAYTLFWFAWKHFQPGGTTFSAP